jgi:hypothetical protein
LKRLFLYFADPLALIFDDASHSEEESRELIVSMKKTSVTKKLRGKGDLLREYRLDYSKAKPNRFAAEMPAETIAVVLEPDIAAVFKSAKTVNAALRSVISGVTKPTRKRTQ